MTYSIGYGETCTICLELPKVGVFELTDPNSDEPKKVVRGKVLSCNHAFHEKCINEYFFREKACPICRKAADLKERTFSSMKTANDPSPNLESYISQTETARNTLMVHKNLEKKEILIEIAEKIMRGEHVPGVTLIDKNSFTINLEG